MLDIHGLKVLYEIKEATEQLAETYPDLNLSYCLYLLNHHSDKNIKSTQIKKDIQCLDAIIEYMMEEEFHATGWGCVSTDNTGTFTFCHQDGRGFAIYSNEKDVHLTTYSILSNHSLPYGMEPNYNFEAVE